MSRVAPLGLVVGGGLLASLIALIQHSDDHELEGVKPTQGPLGDDSRDPSLPRFRLADVRQHDASSTHPWVTCEDKVYDITDWVAAHPGGDVILRAAGGSIEPYWNIFSIHKSAHVREILDQYLIGYIDVADLVDGRPAAEAIEDPFQADPIRDSRLITHTAKPRNAEPPNEELDREFKTPNKLFYVRNHMWVPVVEEEKADKHVLEIELPDGETKKYTLAELKERFPTHKVTAVLQCSGNRRNDMTRHAGKTNGLQWGAGAISNAVWEGVRLADVLADAGLKVADATASTRKGAGEQEDPDANSLHVQFSGLEAYGSSIPLPKVLDPRGDVLLAFGMNGKPLPRDHGFPLRSVVPGTVAARSVKWLSKIVVSDEESSSQWQRRDYKSFGPNEGANPNWDRAVSIQEMPVTSAITGVWVGDCVRKGKVPWMSGSKQAGGIADIAAVERKVGFTARNRVDGPAKEFSVPDCPKETPAEPVAVQGYAYSGGGRGIARVDVSVDGGKTWDQAELLDDCAVPGNCFGNKDWAWKRWRYVGKLPVMALPESSSVSDAATKGECEEEKQKSKHCTTLVVKATDDAYNSQPETHSSIYNARGNLATAWHRLRICPRCTNNGDGKGVTWSTGETFGCGFKKEAEETRESMIRSAGVSAVSK
ncbi:Oxidoreductase, molybdopterin-binding domain-containing protein [Cercophora newfieldiana]|uniref:Nitrate reductase [NADPH] n=1 Tax=Cercophora newfieldiana TaxID=92897 RepID=A0AA39YAK9_9PEZI|nr:Oxidoreductase, molybdopterin-binding domain-containing protein [Cercophora newfieldiana]